MKGASVLVVDDSPTILKLVQIVLTKAGYRVTTASTGEAGLLAAREDRPHLLLVDYLMPDMNGDALCRAMSDDPSLAEVPIVVMSAREDDAGERFARLGNVVDHITKPFSPDALLAVIGHSLEKHTRRAIDDGAPPATELGITVSEPLIVTEDAGEADAALAGDMGTISIADVLMLLADQGQTGTLTLSHRDAQLEVFLRGGRIDFATARGVPEEFLLGRFVVESGQISAAALAAVIEDRRAAGATSKLLGADLIGRGLLTPAGLRKAMSLQTAALLYEALRWGSGRFGFHLRELPPLAREAALALPIDGLIMEGLRRVDEWRLIEREIGDFEMVFVRNDEKVAAFGRGKLLREEQAVLELVNGRNTVKDIIYLTRMGSFDVTKMLYRLLRNKLIRRRVGPIAV